MKKAVMNFIRNEEGVTAIEYGLIAGLVAVAIIAAWGTLSDGLSGLFANIVTYFDDVPASTG